MFVCVLWFFDILPSHPPTPTNFPFCRASQTYVVVGTQSAPCSSVFRLNADGNKEEEVLTRPPHCALPLLDRYCLEMYANAAPRSQPWQAIPNTRCVCVLLFAYSRHSPPVGLFY